MSQPIKNKYTSYLLCSLVLLVSWIAPQFFSLPKVAETLATIPGSAALLLIIYKLWREDIAHERKRELQNKDQDFVLGTASHMASVAYDKHVEFCEEYIRTLQDGIQELFTAGATKEAMRIGRSLVEVRIKHSAWITKDIEDKLKPIENALTTMGINMHSLEYLENIEDRTVAVDKAYRLFHLIIGGKEAKTIKLEEEREKERGIARDEVIEEIRQLLGVTALTELRKTSAELALQRIHISRT